MWAPIEDYALIANSAAAGLVSRTGAIDWLCVPRFDHAACMAALLGDERHGMWVIAPVNGPRTTTRGYRTGSMVLETEIASDDGRIRLVDCMDVQDHAPRVIRLVEGLDGEVDLHMQLVMSFDYGTMRPLVHEQDGRLVALAGPDGLVLDADIEVGQHEQSTVGNTRVRAGDQLAFVLTHFDSQDDPPDPIDAAAAVEHATSWWQGWSGQLNYEGPYFEEVRRSMLVMKALSYAPTGSMVTSPTSSLPEKLGGTRNFDYRYCWLRDSSFTVYALVRGGFEKEARAWRDWLVRTTGAVADKLQPVFGPAGERRINELEASWLPGYEGSTPVMMGNAAASQFQLDVFGEAMDALFECRRLGLEPSDDAWTLQRDVANFVVDRWTHPGAGIWELRGPSRQYVHSKAMAWLALDRAVRMVEDFGREASEVDTWRSTRDAIHEEVLRLGYDEEVGSFVQHYGAKTVDASCLLLVQYGFLPPDDERIVSTVEVIMDRLMVDGWLWRFDSSSTSSGFPESEGAFLATQCWLADALELIGRHDDAVAVYERVLSVANDVGLLSEEYDPATNRLVGNFPLALTHLAVANTARNLSGEGAAHHRAAPALGEMDDDPAATPSDSS